MIAESRLETDMAGCHGSLATSASAITGKDSAAGPTETPMIIAISSRPVATAIARPGRTRPSAARGAPAAASPARGRAAGSSVRLVAAGSVAAGGAAGPVAAGGAGA